MKSICAFLLLTVFLKIDAQQPLTDSAFYALSVNNATISYKKQVQENLHIYNGIEYLRTGHGVKGTPFFASDSLQNGGIFYDGRLYENIPLYYDLVTDDVVINNYAQNNQIKLVPEKVNYFYILQHLFIRITADSLLPSFITTGFYEKLYDGKLSVFARHQKIPRLSINASDNDARYAAYNYYFVLLKNTFYRTDNKSDFLSVMDDKKDAIRKYIKDNKINFNKNREASMVKIAEYYSQLKN
ncbi:MAG: hypothetical protein ABIR15_22640 [Chitinophagaceae bacterium]